MHLVSNGCCNAQTRQMQTSRFRGERDEEVYWRIWRIRTMVIRVVRRNIHTNGRGLAVKV